MGQLVCCRTLQQRAGRQGPAVYCLGLCNLAVLGMGSSGDIGCLLEGVREADDVVREWLGPQTGRLSFLQVPMLKLGAWGHNRKRWPSWESYQEDLLQRV